MGKKVKKKDPRVIDTSDLVEKPKKSKYVVTTDGLVRSGGIPVSTERALTNETPNTRREVPHGINIPTPRDGNAPVSSEGGDEADAEAHEGDTKSSA